MFDPSKKLNLRRHAAFVVWVFVAAILQLGCSSKEKDHAEIGIDKAKSQAETRESRLSQYKPTIADYGLFAGPMNQLIPASGVVEYELNTSLFSDYSQKQRLIKLPAGTSANFTSTGPLDFPVGTVIAKTFYYLADLNDPNSKRQLVETRILEHRADGWVGIPYVWNEAQTSAHLVIAGASIDVKWKHSDGQSRTNSHTVPNLNDCKRCHTNLKMEPIGPKANNLNRDISNGSKTINQLQHWSQTEFLKDLPDLADVQRLAVWNDPGTGTVEERARAYLDVNCAHCHNADGPARNSGLHLNVAESDPYRLGTFKTPVAAGKGTGGRLYGVVPGKPDESIMEYRMLTTEPGEIMPEYGKSLVHEEGHALIRQWIAEMK